MSTTQIKSDPTEKALDSARRSLALAQQVALEDTRTSSTAYSDALAEAVQALDAAARWYADLVEEERRDGIPEPTKSKVFVCSVCEEGIEPGDVTVCPDCGDPICPDCMGEDGVCLDCETSSD